MPTPRKTPESAGMLQWTDGRADQPYTEILAGIVLKDQRTVRYK
jgi:hypothetical protein